MSSFNLEPDNVLFVLYATRRNEPTLKSIWRTVMEHGTLSHQRGISKSPVSGSLTDIGWDRRRSSGNHAFHHIPS